MAFSTTKLALVSLLASSALASANHHRRHRHLRRDIVWETAVVTDVAVVTQYVDAGAPAPSAAAVSTPAPVVQAAAVTPSAVAHEEIMNWNMFGHKAAAAAASSAPPHTTLATVVSSAAPTSAHASSAAPSSSAAAPSASSSPSTGGKRGVAFNSASLTDLFTGSAFSWAYNWGCDASGTILSSLEYVPMLWSNGASFTSSWDSQASAALAAGSKHILGFNEPDHTAQANMSPADAVTAWKQYIEPYSSKAKLVSPAVTNGAAPMGLAWLSSFMSGCSGCTIDAVAIHWYDSATNVEYFKQHITEAHTQTGKPVWITEFGASGSDDQVSAFLSEVLPWLDSQDFVERYSYFMAAEGQLISGGTLSTYGKTYATAA